MAINVGSVGVSVVPSAEGFAEKLRAKIGDIPAIKLVLDTAEAEAKLDIIRAKIDQIRNGATSRVVIDDAAANASIDELKAKLARLRDQTVNVNVNENSSAAGSRMSSAFSAASLASAAKVAVIGEAILALVPLAGAASAAVAAIGAGAIAGVAGLLVGKLALGGVGAAYTAAQQPNASGGGTSASRQSGANQAASAALTGQSQAISQAQAAQSASDGVTSALQTQRTAELNLQAAQRSSIQAQKDLVAARVAALQNLQDLSNSVTDNGLAQRQAALALEDAKRNLQIINDNPDSKNPLNAEAVAQAQLAYDQAQQQVKELALAGSRLSDQKSTADQLGVNGSAGVVSAQQNVLDSHTAVNTAQQALTDATHKLAEAQQNVADTAKQASIQQQQNALSLNAAAAAAVGTGAGLSAYQQAMAQLDPVQQQFTQFLLSIKPALDALKSAAADSFLPLLETAIRAILPLLPTFDKILSSVGTALGTLANEAAAALGGPFWTQFYQFLNTALGPLLLEFGGLIGTLLQVGAAGFQAFLPAITALLSVAKDLFATLATKIEGGALDSIVKFAVASLPLVGTVFKALFAAIQALVKGIAPSSGAILAFFVTLANGIAKLAPFVGSVLGALLPIMPVLAQGFVDLVLAIAPLLPVLASLVTAILPPLIDFIETLIAQGVIPLVAALITGLAPLLPQIALSFTQIFEALKPLIPPLTQVLVKAILQMAPLLPQLVVAFTNLAIAVANLLIALTPILGPLTILFLQLLNKQNMNTVLGVASAVTTLLNALTFVATHIGAAVGGIEKAWSGFFDNLKTIASGVVSPIAATMKTIIDSVIDAVNFMIRALDNVHITLPKIDTHLPGVPSFGGGSIGFNIDQIPRLANGGIINPTANGSLYVGGENHQKEAVVPLDGKHSLGNTIHVHPAAGLDEVAIATLTARRMKFQAV